MAFDALLASQQGSVFNRFGDGFFTFVIGLPVGNPAFALGLERGLLLLAERLDAVRLLFEESLVVIQTQFGFFNAQCVAPEGEFLADDFHICRVRPTNW